MTRAALGVRSCSSLARAFVSSSFALAAAAAFAGCAAGDGERDGGSPGNLPPAYTPPSTTPIPNVPAGTPSNTPAPPVTPAGDVPPPTNVVPPNTGNTGNQQLPASSPTPPSGNAAPLGNPTMGGQGQSSERYHKTAVTRDGQNYFFMANGWGPNFQSQTVSWNGTAFTVQSLQGQQGPNYEPASYPTVFCGVYSDSQSGACGLPATLDSIGSLRTGWAWNANGNAGEYNAAYDIWMGTGPNRESHSGYLMVWYREPPGQQPAGALRERSVTVQNVPGTWDIWTGTVFNRPIINWVRAEGADTSSMEFDILDFVRDAQARGLQIPGTHVLSVAVGFEIWNGPITNLESVDFYVDVQ